jgi:tRNA(fMet)-specific endonuclease VapC
METLQDEPLGISVFVACDLLMGAELSARPLQEKERIDRICESVSVDFPDEQFAPTLARQYARLERSGGRVPTMDLMIATSAILRDAPLVTRNVKDFDRISELRVLAYKGS